jgi:hypothetical protein
MLVRTRTGRRPRRRHWPRAAEVTGGCRASSVSGLGASPPGGSLADPRLQRAHNPGAEPRRHCGMRESRRHSGQPGPGPGPLALIEMRSTSKLVVIRSGQVRSGQVRSGQVYYSAEVQDPAMRAKRKKNVRELTERRCPNERRARESVIAMVMSLESFGVDGAGPRPSRQVRQTRSEA